MEQATGKVTGIGGVFFIAKDPDALRKWYHQHLGISSILYRTEEFGDRKEGYAVWNVFSKRTPLFRNVDKPYCWSYRVDDLGMLLQNLATQNVQPIQPNVEDENGKFGFIKDPEGNKIILWQPSSHIPHAVTRPRVEATNLGGVFFKSKNPAELNEWYRTRLGFEITKWGCSFNWIDPQDPSAAEPASTAWSLFKEDSDYFLPSTKPFMLNYRVKNLHALIDKLVQDGVTIVGSIEDSPYGKFCRVMDPEGNKIELWQP